MNISLLKNVFGKHSTWETCFIIFFNEDISSESLWKCTLTFLCQITLNWGLGQSMSLSAYTPSPTIRLGALFSIIVAFKNKINT